ncbi:MAG: hypothetical protein V4482_02605 [Pseudomonadota bacterium]
MIIPFTPFSMTSSIIKSINASFEIKQIPVMHTDVKFKSNRSEKDGNTSFVRGVSEVESAMKVDSNDARADYPGIYDHDKDGQKCPEHLLDIIA